MLIVGDRRILLVPKRIVSYSLDYTPQRYTQHFVLNFLQQDHLSRNTSLVQTRRNKKGKITKRFVTKKSLREHIGHISKDWLADFTARHPEVFHNFKKNTEQYLKLISHEELTTSSLHAVIAHLIGTLRAINGGAEQASFYHRTVTGILELLFYPRLTSPQVEREIHEGRKRIDLTFDNSAEIGFFYRLATTHNTPCRFIFIECKNYNREIANPELDQISGRFSPNRGKFGLIVCRNIDDMDTFLMRCADTYKDDRGIVLPIVDQDLLDMLSQYEEKGVDFCEEILADRFRSIALR